MKKLFVLIALLIVSNQSFAFDKNIFDELIDKNVLVICQSKEYSGTLISVSSQEEQSISSNSIETTQRQKKASDTIESTTQEQKVYKTYITIRSGKKNIIIDADCISIIEAKLW
jgi:small nuclear ribonucleoprotein (snRNP)-like protein